VLGVIAGLGPKTWINGLSAKIFFVGATFSALVIAANEQSNNAPMKMINF
jgi:hypothetical protein